MAKYPEAEAAKVISTRREMEACSNQLKGVYMFLFFVALVLLSTCKATALLTAVHGNVAVVNTSQSLSYMPFCRDTDEALPCLTHRPHLENLTSFVDVCSLPLLKYSIIFTLKNKAQWEVARTRTRSSAIYAWSRAYAPYGFSYSPYEGRFGARRSNMAYLLYLLYLPVFRLDVFT